MMVDYTSIIGEQELEIKTLQAKLSSLEAVLEVINFEMAELHSEAKVFKSQLNKTTGVLALLLEAEDYPACCSVKKQACEVLKSLENT
jgi:septal ring factor EnvC (AmiA/AmiB activator)